jgi:hypothetical protein
MIVIAESEMQNCRHHKLIVEGLRSSPAEFAEILERAVYSDRQVDGRVEVVPGELPEFRFATGWDEPDEDLAVLETNLADLSKEQHGKKFLLDYRSSDKQRRGQFVLSRGIWLEEIDRGGYGPGPWYEITHPIVNLFEAHLGRRTLAQAAKSRVQDAIEIVNQLKAALESERDSQHKLEHKPDSQRLEGAITGLTEMLSNMKNHAAQISFEGMLLEEREAKARI